MVTEIQPYQTQELSPQQFDQALAYGQAKAKALQVIVESQHLFMEIRGKKHLQVEAWETIAEGYGLSARIEWSRPLETGGWEARASVVDRQGNIVGGAEAECGTDGDGNWLDRASFQQRSMAQTRAISKALRSRLSWVVVLAGYSPTPAEEMIPGEAALKQGGENWCAEHQVTWFKRGRMPGFAHQIQGTGKWCNKPTEAKAQPSPEAIAPLSQGKMTATEFWSKVNAMKPSPGWPEKILGMPWLVFVERGGTFEEALAKIEAAQAKIQESKEVIQ